MAIKIVLDLKPVSLILIFSMLLLFPTGLLGTITILLNRRNKNAHTVSEKKRA
jgi:hypothetical protein